MEDGAPAVLIVEGDLRLALGPAPTLLQLMVVKIVSEMLIKYNPAIRTFVQVRKSFVGE